MGLGFLLETAYLLPLTIAVLTVAVGALGFRAERRRGYGPFAVGVMAALVLLVCKFVIESSMMLYGGIAALVSASLWNSWPSKRITSVPSTPEGTLHQIGSIKKEI